MGLELLESNPNGHATDQLAPHHEGNAINWLELERWTKKNNRQKE